ncbi:hypothetical protein QYF36_023769 [Acer negundo]|nr:hypothetical protein QYF36_023769 [Acer negundo]
MSRELYQQKKRGEGLQVESEEANPLGRIRSDSRVGNELIQAMPLSEGYWQVCYWINPIIRDDEIRQPRIPFCWKSLPRNQTHFRGMTKCDKEQVKTNPWS